MGRRLIPVREVIKKWSEEPAYRAAYDGLAGEFALASATIEGRAAARTLPQRAAKTFAPIPRPRRS